MTKQRHKFLRTAALSGVAGALLVTGLGRGLLGGDPGVGATAGHAGRDDKRRHRLPGAAQGRSRRLHQVDRHHRQLLLHPVGQPADQDRRRRRGAHLLRRRHRRRLVQGGRVLPDEMVHAAQQVLQRGVAAGPVPPGRLVHPQRASCIGMPSDASLLVTDVNTKDFAKAGITTMPTTFAQYQADLKPDPEQGRRRPSPRHPVRRRRGAVDLLVRDDRGLRRRGAQQLLQAGVHVALLRRLQGDDLDGGGLQGRPRAQGQPRPGGLPGLQRRPGRKPDGQRVLGLLR